MFWRDNYAMDFLAGDYVIYAKNVPILILYSGNTHQQLISFFSSTEFVDGQFYEECSNSEPCDSSQYLTCMNRKCLCINTHYHRDQVCYPSTW